MVEPDDDEAWWVNGVNPGGVCAPGTTPQEALKSFRLAYNEVLLDCALRCPTFVSFRSEVELIFNSTTPDLLDEWQEAAMALRAGGRAGPLEGLKREPCDSREYGVTVQEIITTDAEPQHDSAPRYAQAA